MRGVLLVVFLATCLMLINADSNKEGRSFFKPYPGNCPRETNILTKWIELPHLCISIEHDLVDHSTAAEVCSKEHKRSRLLTVGSLRKFLHVDVEYLAQGSHEVEGPFWVDARYHGDGRWSNTRNKREVRFEYFPNFDAHRAKEGEALIWDPKEGHLTAAHPGEKYRFICESNKFHVKHCRGKPECHDRGDCIEGECYCEFPAFGDKCQYFGCSPACDPREVCDLKNGKCYCPPYMEGPNCNQCANSRQRSDGSQVCYVSGPKGVTYLEALKFCTKQGMILAEIKTPAEVANVLEFATPSQIWLGATDLASPNVFEWNSGHPVAPYTNWILAGPNVTSSADECVRLAATDGLWNNVGCFSNKAYVCQIPWATALSTAGLQCLVTAMQDPCYLIVTTPASYDDASLDCIQKGGFLAPIKTPEEQAKIMALKTAAGVGALWFGLRGTNGAYYFSDGTLLPTKPIWATGEPTVPSGAENCLTFDTVSGTSSNNLCTGGQAFDTLCESPQFPLL